MYLQLSIRPPILQLQFYKKKHWISNPVFSISLFYPKFNVMLNLVIPNITPGAYFRGGLYMEGVFRFKSWFLNAPGLIQGGAYYRNFTVYILKI